MRFEQGDATVPLHEAEFDIVTAARTLQWIARPERAVEAMARAAKPGGTVVVLDYNHTQHTWDPAPPAEFRSFFEALLKWRRENGWVNDIGDRLPELFAAAGLTNIEISAQDETGNARMWSEAIDNVGPQLIGGGYRSQAELVAARDAYETWLLGAANHGMNLRAAIGRKP
jgi:SAM-dependent methyltransferase